MPPRLMKIAFAFLASAAFIISFSSCDSHPWEETKDLHEGMHGAHGAHDAHGDVKGAGHEKTIDHAKPEHVEKPKANDHGQPAAEAKPATGATEKKAH